MSFIESLLPALGKLHERLHAQFKENDLRQIYDAVPF